MGCVTEVLLLNREAVIHLLMIENVIYRPLSHFTLCHFLLLPLLSLPPSLSPPLLPAGMGWRALPEVSV